MTLPTSLNDLLAETNVEQNAHLLFKYLDVAGAKAMLVKSNLQFTNAMRLNDPFDCNPGLWVDFSNPYSHTNEYLENVKRDGLDKYSEFRRNTFVCSLSKVYDSILMWSYYNKHEGVCLGIDVECLEFSLFLLASGAGGNPSEVQYPNIIEKLNFWKNPNADGGLRRMLYTKAPEWAHEKEVRIHAYLPNADDPNYHRPQLDSQCFASMYLGVNMSDRDKEEIIRLARKLNPNIKICQSKVNPDAFKLDFIEIR
jgi:hypothetical protein